MDESLFSSRGRISPNLFNYLSFQVDESFDPEQLEWQSLRAACLDVHCPDEEFTVLPGIEDLSDAVRLMNDLLKVSATGPYSEDAARLFVDIYSNVYASESYHISGSPDFCMGTPAFSGWAEFVLQQSDGQDSLPQGNGQDVLQQDEDLPNDDEEQRPGGRDGETMHTAADGAAADDRNGQDNPRPIGSDALSMMMATRGQEPPPPPKNPVGRPRKQEVDRGYTTASSIYIERIPSQHFTSHKAGTCQPHTITNFNTEDPAFVHPRPVGAPKKGCTWDGIQGAWVRIGDDYVCAYTHGRARACVCVRGLMCDVYVFFSPGSLSACLYTCHTNRWPTVSKEEETPEWV